MRACGPNNAAENVPGSVRIARQRGGYASSAICEGSLPVFQSIGAAVGCSHANGPAPGAAGPAPWRAAPPQPARARTATSATAARTCLDVAVAIARPAVVVRILIAAVVLRDPVAVAVAVMALDRVIPRRRVRGRVTRAGHRRRGERDERYKRQGAGQELSEVEVHWSAFRGGGVLVRTTDARPSIPPAAGFTFPSGTRSLAGQCPAARPHLHATR